MKAKLLLAAGTLAMLATGLPVQVQAQSRGYCEDYAYRVAYRRGSSNGDAIGQGAIGGAIAGGVLGGLLGHGHGKNIVGGAIAGTAAGAVLGAAGSRGDGYIDRRAYRIAYNDCMDRGRPVRYYSRASRSDIEYCSAKYRSYNPSTGMYMTYGGQYRPCP